MMIDAYLALEYDALPTEELVRYPDKATYMNDVTKRARAHDAIEAQS